MTGDTVPYLFADGEADLDAAHLGEDENKGNVLGFYAFTLAMDIVETLTFL